MTPERWAQVRRIFDAALERESRDRAAYVRVVCASDDQLRREVEALLASHAQSEDFLAEPAVNIDRTLLYGDEEPPDYPEGYRVGVYQLERRIGRGGMGSVWVASRVDHEFEKRVAIKLVKRGMDSHEILRRFRMERQLLASLDHPNIARLIDGGSTTDGLPYLVMEYVEGTPVDVYCETHKSTITERLQLFRAVCSAAQYAHQNLIVHRDIKASNILVTPDGVPKLLDFGIAKLLRPDFSTMEIAAQTRPEQRPMTLDYASPEQVRGEAITTATDVYSLGVLLYKLLTGKFPYQADRRSAHAMQKAICEMEPRRPSAVILADNQVSIPQATQKMEVIEETRDKARKRLRKKLAGDLDTIILKALHKEPARRYASVEQFSEDVRRYLEGLPVSARSDSFGYRFTKFVRRHTAGVAAATLIGLALVISTFVSAYYARAADLGRQRAEHRFNEVRQLARFVLFDFDDVIREGVMPARKRVISQALDYLNRLQKEAGQEPSLQREIMEAYFRVGDVQANLYEPNLGDASGAAASYRKALAIAQALYRASPASAEARRNVARADVKLGDLLALGVDGDEALKRYQEALTHFEALAAADSSNLKLRQDVMMVSRKIGFAQFQMGDLLGALASYTRYLQIAEGQEALESASGKAVGEDTLRAVASGYDHVGEILARNGARDEGLVKLRKALDIYNGLLASDPENAAVRRSVLIAHQVMGDVLLGGGRAVEGVDAYRKSIALLETQLKGDPQNRQSQRDLAAGLGRLADALVKAGRPKEARPVTERALTMLKPLIELSEPSAFDIQQYCWLLVTTPFADLRNPAAAVRYAQRAVEITRESDPAMLDTLARAHELNGDFRLAVETGQKALALLPAGTQSDLRRELEANLARFRRSLEKAPTVSSPPPTSK